MENNCKFNADILGMFQRELAENNRLIATGQHRLKKANRDARRNAFLACAWLGLFAVDTYTMCYLSRHSSCDNMEYIFYVYVIAMVAFWLMSASVGGTHAAGCIADFTNARKIKNELKRRINNRDFAAAQVNRISRVLHNYNR